MRSFGSFRSVPSPSNPIPSPQQQQQQVQTTAKLKKEKKKPLTPFHHRPLVEREGPETVKSHVGTVSKGLPTVNVLTAVNQKRHAEVAGPNQTLKRYPWHTQAAPVVTGSTSNLGIKLEMASTKEDFPFIHFDLPLRKVDADTNEVSQGTMWSEDGVNFRWRDSVETKASWKDKGDFLLPKEGRFDLPVLPGNSLDCRIPQDNVPSTAKYQQSPQPSQTIFWER